MTKPFWETKPLSGLSPEEWESLCDGCGRCCLIRLEDEDSGATAETNIACRLLDLGTCRCGDYANRAALVPDCVVLTPQNIGSLGWMPSSCAYRRLAEGRGLELWHPLISGRAGSVAEAGIAVGDYAISETEIDPEELEAYITAIERKD